MGGLRGLLRGEDMKAAYALGFLGLCAIVLVVHVYDTQEEAIKDSDTYNNDPFLASLEKHVVARAQRSIRQRAAKKASETHISEARKAIKAALMDAESSNIHQINTVMAASAKQQEKARKKAKNAGKTALERIEAIPADGVEDSDDGHQKFTWAQLQAGEDAQTDTKNDKKVGSLLSSLKSAPSGKAEDEQSKAAAQEQKVDMLEGALASAKAEAHVGTDDQDDQDPDDVLEESEEDDEEQSDDDDEEQSDDDDEEYADEDEEFEEEDDDDSGDDDGNSDGGEDQDDDGHSSDDQDDDGHSSDDQDDDGHSGDEGGDDQDDDGHSGDEDGDDQDDGSGDGDDQDDGGGNDQDDDGSGDGDDQGDEDDDYEEDDYEEDFEDDY